jgi:CheY-like chemotaxis protein
MASPTPAASSLRVLIVEDDENVASMLVNVLAHVGVRLAHAAGTKAEALSLIGGPEPAEIVFVDINLDVPRGGVEVAKAASARGLYVIIITGDVRVPDDLAGHALLLKPFSVDQVQFVISDARRHFRR